MARSTAGTRPAVDTTDEWTAGELAEVRAELVDEVAQLREQVVAEEAVINGLAAGQDGGGDDPADAGAATQDREQEMSMAAHARSMLAQTERAIARLDAGTYGVCEGCGGPIPKGRLQARPKVTLCVTCQQREDRR